MGIPSRHAGAPYADGETLSGSDLETDVANLYTEIANIEDANVASGANINGSKLADATIANAKMTANTLTTAKMNQSAVPQAYVSSSTTAASFSTATTYADVPNITAATITPGAVGDYIFLDLCCVARVEGTGEADYMFTFSVDGTDQTATARLHTDDNSNWSTVTAIYAGTATATTAMVFKPRYKCASALLKDAEFSTDCARTFRALVLPQK